jgi:hypothetical protein
MIDVLSSRLGRGEIEMVVYTIAVLLLVAWLFGLAGVYTVGPFVHALMIVAIVLFGVGLFRGRRILA